MAVTWNPRTSSDYYWLRTDASAYYPTYAYSTTATSPTYTFAYNPYVRKTKTIIDEVLFEKPKPKPEPEPASEKELHDFLFGGEDK